VSGITGRTYYERGQPVVVVIRWGVGAGPRNVLIQRADGVRVVRPFRGLRRNPPARNRGKVVHLIDQYELDDGCSTPLRGC
jgi:hypothetical protein